MRPGKVLDIKPSRHAAAMRERGVALEQEVIERMCNIDIEPLHPNQ
jgi:hypothetical protein